MIPRLLAPKTTGRILLTALGLLLISSACLPAQRTIPSPKPPPAFLTSPTIGIPSPTPLPTRPSYSPGTLVDYFAQTGDTIPALAAHFNSTPQEIRAANPIVPTDVTTLPPGLPMKLPIYYQSLWGSPFKIIPDSSFINGPGEIGFDPVKYVNSTPGWFKDYEEFVGGKQRKGGELIEYLANNYSISPRLLLAMLEYQTGSLTQPIQDPSNLYLLGFIDKDLQGLYRQLHRATNVLNFAYYGWRTGTFKSFEHLDGRLERPDPFQNAATVALHYIYSKVLPKEQFEKAIHSHGLIQTYRELFGNPWQNVQPHIPGSLQQPALSLPFSPGKTWTFTGGPHSAWGENTDLTALDFAPPMSVGGCTPTPEFATAIADGIVARTGIGVVILDLDGDGDEKTGWAILYLHVATMDMVRQGAVLKKGDPVGHPSCEGGTSTGTHIHIARKYNGEWIPADGPLAFNLEGWRAQSGAQPYLGNLVRYSNIVRACVCSDKNSQIISGKLE